MKNMSQTSGYQYQTYGDPNNPLKTELTPMVNDQATRNLQNGLQSPHYNLTGILSSQSSRDPSRETSRDPSPTQYLHNQYRPQLPRPPMPPINGQQNVNLNVISPPPRMPQVSQYSSTAIAYNNQFGSNAMNTMPSSDASNVPPTFVSHSLNVQLNHGSGRQAAVSTAQSEALQSHSSSDVPPAVMTKKDLSLIQNYQWSSNPKVANVSLNASNTPASNSADSPKKQNQIPGQTPLNPPYNQINKTLPQTLATGQNQIPLSTANITQPSSNGNQPLHQNSQVLQNAVFPNTMSPRNLPQTGFESQTKSIVSPESVPAYASQSKFGSQQNIYNNIQSTQSTTQSMSSMHNLGLNKSQNMSGSQNFGTQDSLHPLQTKAHQSQCLHSQIQSSSFNNQIDSQNLGPTSRQSQNIYGSQQNLASQKRYPQNPYGTQIPPNTANFSNSGLSGVRPNAPPATTQYQVRPTPAMLPGQQMYSGQMSNVPLDSMTKRYPNSYPDQMNQLNNQISNLTVTQTGYNKLWGMESVDLLQCRNVLPPERVEPPKIRLHQEFLDGVNCSPDIFRCTLTKIPESNSLLQKSRLPLGILIHPFKDLNHLPVIQCSTIVRCRACRAYINPFIYFVDSKRWKCNLCYRVNELPEEFQFDPVTKSYGDPSRRPEVKTSTIEFIAPGEYMLRPPQPAVYLFILDVSRLAVESGYLTVVCNVIAEELSRLPGDGRTQIGFLAVDSAIHFFSMPDNVSQPHEMIMLDVDDVFLPCPENLIVNLKEHEELVRDLLAQLPTKFQETHDTNCALGAGLQAAYKLMSPTGGRVTVFQTCLPNLGPGMLQPREDPNNRANKDVPHLNPATDFYKRLALDCNGQQIAVDLFLLNSQYSDLATLSGMCKFSGGCIYHIPLFRASKSQSVETLEKILRRYLTRKIGFEAVMRIRCTRGLSIHTFHGNFFVRSTDLLTLPNINPDAGFGMQISIEENLSDIQNVCFQAALLYTSSKGERRIRVHTLCLPVIASLSDILYSADQQCIVGLLCKMAVDRSQQSSLSDARDALINVAIDVLSAYKLSQSVGSAGLLAPGSLKLLPLYIIALLKCIAFRSGTSTRLDDRVFAMCQLKTLPLFQLIQMMYPDLYPIHALDDRNSKDIDGKVCPQPPRLHLSAEKLDSRGAFLMDAGDKIFIYIGKNIHPSFCYNILGVPAFASIPEELYELPELDTVENERLRNFIFSLQEEKPFCASVQIIRDDSHFRTLFVERLIEDRFESALSYYEFLQHLKTQVK